MTVREREGKGKEKSVSVNLCGKEIKTLNYSSLQWQCVGLGGKGVP